MVDIVCAFRPQLTLLERSQFFNINFGHILPPGFCYPPPPRWITETSYSMRVMFIHQNFPGQFRHIASHWASDPSNQVLSIAQKHAPGLASVPSTIYGRTREVQPGTHHYLIGLEQAVLNAQGVSRVCMQLKQKGFVPDVVIGHTGWGETLYIKDIFPETKLINYFEFFYRATGADTNFDPEYPSTADDYLRIRTKNTANLLSLDGCDAGVSPTGWQHSTYPREYTSKISVIHEGIDTDIVKPDAAAQFVLEDGRVLTKADEVITYVARNLEPYRGFHIFMRAVEKICQRRPNAHILIAGEDGVSYGKRLPDGKTYRQQLLEEVELNSSRVHFLGRLPYESYLKVLQISSVHVYLTVPFVLSWSMMEAMSAACVVLGSNTQPVTELIQDQHNGLLTDFFSPDQVAEKIDMVFSHPERMTGLGIKARETILQTYTIKHSIQNYEKMLKRLGVGIK